MANTYNLIQSYTLASDISGGVTFSNIPNTYTHLIINFSTKGNRSNTRDDLKITINGSNGNYSNVRFYGSSGGGVGSDGGTGTTFNYIGFASGATASSTIFGNGDIIFPNYISNTLKNTISNSGVSASTSDGNVYQLGYGSLSAPTSVTQAISSINISSYNGTGLNTGSTLYLYGLKNT